MAEFCIAAQVVFFVGAFFEGYIGARIGSNVVMIVMIAAIGNYLLRNAPLAAEYVEHEVHAEAHSKEHEPEPSAATP
jgi:uncharacterized membrane protein YfcA